MKILILIPNLIYLWILLNVDWVSVLNSIWIPNLVLFLHILIFNLNFKFLTYWSPIQTYTSNMICGVVDSRFKFVLNLGQKKKGSLSAYAYIFPFGSQFLMVLVLPNIGLVSFSLFSFVLPARRRCHNFPPMSNLALVSAMFVFGSLQTLYTKHS